MNRISILKAYQQACDCYSGIGVSVEAALNTLDSFSLSLHCWPGDDLCGFERPDSRPAATCAAPYPGRARTPAELRADLAQALGLIPGRHRVDLHAIYGEFEDGVDRDRIGPEHISGWIEWAREQQVGRDLNATCFGHPKTLRGFTLSSKNQSVRAFWVEHVRRCRGIAAAMGKALGSPSLHALWIPDGCRDMTVDRSVRQELLRRSLDEIFADQYPSEELIDALEPRLAGNGGAAFTPGSYDFYLGYAIQRNLHLCLGLSNFHPTESVADKLPALLAFLPGLALRLSRGLRWDRGHPAILNDPVREVAAEAVRAGALDRIRFGLDFLEPAMNRVGAWVVGARALLKALLSALLEPRNLLLAYEETGDAFARLALLEEMKSMPLGAVWDYYCMVKEVPVSTEVIVAVEHYDREIRQARGG